MMSKKTVLVGLSGGVDSSVAAYWLKKQGYRVKGVFIRIFPDWLADFLKSQGRAGCPWALDQRYAQQVAEKLDIPFYVFDLSADYQRKVLDNFEAEYRLARTPNPDVLCNKYLKFGSFWRIARKAGADYIATGHYVKKRGQRLYRGRDRQKDQSYFLWMLSQSQLERSLFPLADYTKEQVRETARKAGLASAEKPDSQGICFLGQFRLADFLKQKIPPRKGEIITTGAEMIGRHQGVWFYTIGQRLRGAELKIKKSSFRGRDMPGLYVVDKDIKRNRLVVGTSDDPQLFFRELMVKNISWIAGQPPRTRQPLDCQIRYGQPPQKCIIHILTCQPSFSSIDSPRLQRARLSALSAQKSRQGGTPSFCACESYLKRGWSRHNIRVVFEKPQRAAAPGQSVVFYRGEELLGGGVIQ